MATEIGRIGKTIAVELPEELLQEAGFAVGQTVEWRLNAQGWLEMHPGDGLPEVDDDESGRWAQILAHLTADREGKEGIEPANDWTLSHGTEYKRPWEE